MSRVILGVLDHGMDCDLFKLWHIAECDGFAEEAKNVGTTRTAQGTVLVVRTCAFPGP